MLTIERREQILGLLKEQGTATVGQISSRFYISPATVRRDLTQLEKEGQIKRVHGGAAFLEGLDQDSPLLLRENENLSAKESIADKTMRLLPENAVLMLDSSTTVLALAKRLRALGGISVISNGIKTVSVLSDSRISRLYCTGGVLREHSMSLVGDMAGRFVQRLNADFFVFSCRGLSLMAGVTESSDDEAVLKRKMLDSSAKKILLADSSKFNKIFISKMCAVSELDYIVTEKMPDERFVSAIKEARVNLICSE